MPGLDPGGGERGVIDELDLAEPSEHRRRCLVGYSALPQRRRELSPGPRGGRQHPEADLPGGRFLAGSRFLAARCPLAGSRFLAARCPLIGSRFLAGRSLLA